MGKATRGREGKEGNTKENTRNPKASKKKLLRKSLSVSLEKQQNVGKDQNLREGELREGGAIEERAPMGGDILGREGKSYVTNGEKKPTSEEGEKMRIKVQYPQTK